MGRDVTVLRDLSLGALRESGMLQLHDGLLLPRFRGLALLLLFGQRFGPRCGPVSLPEAWVFD